MWQWIKQEWENTVPPQIDGVAHGPNRLGKVCTKFVEEREALTDGGSQQKAI